MRHFFHGVVVAAALAGAAGARVAAQQAQGAPPPAVVPPAARVAAPIDMAGTWASVITEDWQWRFVTPIVGDYTGVPLNADGDRLARQWNPDADLKAGQQCKGFGAAAINRLPTRMQVSWVDDNTMKLDFDLGTFELRDWESPGSTKPVECKPDSTERGRSRGDWRHVQRWKNQPGRCRDGDRRTEYESRRQFERQRRSNALTPPCHAEDR